MKEFIKFLEHNALLIAVLVLIIILSAIFDNRLDKLGITAEVYELPFYDGVDYENNNVDQYGPWWEMTSRNGTAGEPWYNLSSSNTPSTGWYPARIVSDPEDRNNPVLSLYVPREERQPDQKKRGQAEIRNFGHIDDNEPAGIKFRMYPNHDVDVNQEMFFEWKARGGVGEGTILAIYEEPDGEGNMACRITYKYGDADNPTTINVKRYDFKFQMRKWHYFTLNITNGENGGGRVKLYGAIDREPGEEDLIWSYSGRLGFFNTTRSQAQLKNYKFVWNSRPSAWQDSKDAGIDYRDLLFDDFQIQYGYFDVGGEIPPIEPPDTIPPVDTIPPPELPETVRAVILDTLTLQLIPEE